MVNDSLLETFRCRLGDLANADSFRSPIDLKAATPSAIVSQLEMMATIRFAEEKIAEGVIDGKIKCPCHLAIGQEAIPVAVSSHLRSTDHVFGTHRSHGHFIAQGGTTYELFAEVLGKVTGCSKGMGGSMHLYKGATGFVGSVPIVSATVSLAVGAALAAKSRLKSDIAVTYFGDGAMEEGSVHESLNFASVYQLPVIFVVENNLFSSHLHIGLRQPYDSISRFGAANGMAWEVVDGNDPVAMGEAAQRLIQRARDGKGPGLLEAVTYRWRGHVGPSEDIDVGVKRKDDLAKWKGRDPIRRTLDALIAADHLRPSDWESAQMRIRKQINHDWDRALSDPYPPISQLTDTVYAEGSPGPRRGWLKDV